LVCVLRSFCNTFPVHRPGPFGQPKPKLREVCSPVYREQHVTTSLQERNKERDALTCNKNFRFSHAIMQTRPFKIHDSTLKYAQMHQRIVYNTSTYNYAPSRRASMHGSVGDRIATRNDGADGLHNIMGHTWAYHDHMIIHA